MPRKRDPGSSDGFKAREDGKVFNEADAIKLSRMEQKDEEKRTDNQKKVIKLLRERKKAQEELNKAEEKSLSSKTKLNKSTEDLTKNVRASLNPFNQLARGMDALGRAAVGGINSITNFLNPLNLMSLAINGLVALYENWFRLTNLMVAAQGRFAMATGATGAQLGEFRREVNMLRDDFSRLGGSVDGITDASNFLSENLLALRRNVSVGITEDFAHELLFLERNFSLTSEQAAQMWRIIEDGSMTTATSLEEAGRTMMDFADDIGANASTMMQELVNSRDALARFGETATSTFQDAATFANHFGIETSRVLAMTARYQSFSNAASSVNELNAMFGTTISSLELMLETDPTRQMNLILESVRSVSSAATITGPQLAALANRLGVGEADARRLLNGDSMEEISREAAERAATEEATNRRRERALTSISDLILDTGTVLRSWGDLFQQIINDVSESLSPIFGTLYDNVARIVQSIRVWVRTILDNPEFRNTMQEIADYIETMPDHIDEFLPTWEEIRDTAAEIWPIVRSIGEALVSVVSFMAEHPQAVGIGLGVLVIAGLLANFASLAVLFSPAGAILVGIGLLVAGFLRASEQASILHDRVSEISAIEESRRTAAEVATRAEGRGAALAALEGTGESNNILTRGAAGLGEIGAGIARFAGAEGYANTVEAGINAGTATYGDMERNARTALAGGAGVSAVVNAIMANAAEGGPNAAEMIRRSFDLSGSGNLREGLVARIADIDREENPGSYLDNSGTTEAAASPEIASAIETAPSTSATASAAPIIDAATARLGGERETFMAEVILDGDRVGSAILRRAVRSS